MFDNVPKALQRPLPSKVPPPQLAETALTPPTGNEWLHEIKLDGYRMLARIDGADIRLVSRNGVDWTDKFPGVLPQLQSLDAKQAILDGEMTVLAPDGTTRFGKLRGGRSNADLLVYFVFDLLYLDGWDVRRAPLVERKNVLRDLMSELKHPDTVQYAEHFDADGKEVFENVRRLGLEGIVSKLRGSPYRSGKSHDWLKTKNKELLPFIIVGFEKGGTDTGFELHLGYSDGDGNLVHAGKSWAWVHFRRADGIAGQAGSSGGMPVCRKAEEEIQGHLG